MKSAEARSGKVRSSSSLPIETDSTPRPLEDGVSRDKESTEIETSRRDDIRKRDGGVLARSGLKHGQRVRRDELKTLRGFPWRGSEIFG